MLQFRLDQATDTDTLKTALERKVAVKRVTFNKSRRSSKTTVNVAIHEDYGVNQHLMKEMVAILSQHGDLA